MDKIFLINGPNLNLLGTRSPDIYGSSTLADVLASVEVRAKEYKLKVESLQSNHEGELIDFLQRANHEAKAVIINPGGYAHTSVALRDAVEAVSIPVIEVHISNIFAREPFRHQSYISEVSDGVICGLGTLGYQLAVEAAAAKISLQGYLPAAKIEPVLLVDSRTRQHLRSELFDVDLDLAVVVVTFQKKIAPIYRSFSMFRPGPRRGPRPQPGPRLRIGFT